MKLTAEDINAMRSEACKAHSIAAETIKELTEQLRLEHSASVGFELRPSHVYYGTLSSFIDDAKIEVGTTAYGSISAKHYLAQSLLNVEVAKILMTWNPILESYADTYRDPANAMQRLTNEVQA